MTPACEAFMSKPNTMSSAKTSAVTPMYAATSVRARPGVVLVYAVSRTGPGARTSDIGVEVMIVSYCAEVTTIFENMV